MGARTCNDPAHETARRAVEAERLADRTYGTPCLVCGAPVYGNGLGHDAGCDIGRRVMADRLARDAVVLNALKGYRDFELSGFHTLRAIVDCIQVHTDAMARAADR